MEFGEPHGRKQEYTPLPQIYNVIGLETEKYATKGSESARECRTRRHGMGKHLGNDEQNS